MRTKLARTVVKLVIANTTVPSSATSLPTLFVVSAAMLVTWREIVQTDNEVRTGAMTALVVHLALQLVALVLGMLLTESTR
jgi:hypothetical protein